MSESDNPQATLRRAGELPDAAIDLGEIALALAALQRPRVDLGRYRHHLKLLVRDVRQEAERRAGGTHEFPLRGRMDALNAVILGKYGYAGDRMTYDDLQNANLMRVIDRRKGLPVTLGILYLHTATGLEWPAEGLGFPGHFLVRLSRDGERAIVDPFNDGRSYDTAGLRDLLKATHGMDAELEPGHYEPVSPRSILLRLQNNIKIRLVRDSHHQRALEVLQSMLLIAPTEPELWREFGALNAHQGNLTAAIQALETCLEHEERDTRRHAIAAFVQQLRQKLN